MKNSLYVLYNSGPPFRMTTIPNGVTKSNPNPKPDANPTLTVTFGMGALQDGEPFRYHLHTLEGVSADNLKDCGNRTPCKHPSNIIPDSTATATTKSPPLKPLPPTPSPLLASATFSI